MTTIQTAYNFKAIFSLLPTKNGGRQKPVYSHYRPSFSFSSSKNFSGEVMFPELEELKPLNPGDTTTAFIKLLPSRHIRKTLKSGDSFTILEGGKIVGTGVIQEVQKEYMTPIIR